LYMKKNHKLNRRQFVKTASSVVGAFCFIPGKILGKNGGVAPSNRITMGCIGVGGMGTSNLTNFLGKEEVQVLAVCDVDRDHRNHARDMINEKYGSQECVTYNDFRELLDRTDLDAVSLAVPDHWHAIPAIMAARKGLDIYAEKPLAYTIAEGRAIVDAVKRYGTVWQTGSWQRSQRNFRFASELVRNGRIGKVHTVRVGLPAGNSINKGATKPCDPPEGFDYDMWLGPAPWAPYSPARCHWNFRWISDYSGGQLTDWAGHHCDIANWAMDTEHSAPVEIEGKADYPYAEEGLFDTPPTYYFECKYAEGFTMIVADARQQPKGMGAHFIGTEGWVHVSRGSIDAHPKSLLNSAILPNEIHLYKSEDHWGNFIDGVRNRKPTIAPAEVAHRSIMIGHLGGIAMRLGRKVYWDAKNERFINDPHADRLLTRSMRSPWHI
jgi:predicted dehydrogenase